MKLRLLHDIYAVAKVDGPLDFSRWAHAGEFVQVVRTPDELSVVCRDDAIPSGVTAERGWRCFTFDEPVDLSKLGVLSSIALPLAKAKVPIFVVSTFDNDYVFVRTTDLERAMAALSAAGFSFGSPASAATS
jgi:uncharacterized protein